MNKNLENFFEFLRFPSVSTDSQYKQGVDDCRDWVHKQFQNMGLNSKIFKTQGHDIVVAQNQHISGRPTVLIYGHYDVQPVDPLNLWATPPFEPTLRNGKVYARGSADNKGQVLAHMIGIKEQLETKKDLGVNVTFLVEGEEEIGSPNLESFVSNNKELLKCDVVVISDSGMVGKGIPTLTYALRGIATVELKIKGPAMDLHSGMYGGGVRNPALAAAQIAASLHDANGRVLIPGFYDGVEEPKDWEKKEWSTLPTSEKDIRELIGVSDLYGEKGYSYFERVWARPTVEINGIGGGYQGEGSKTVLPSEALLKVSFRMVPGQNPHNILENFKKHVNQLNLQGVVVTIKNGHTGNPYICDPSSSFAKLAISSLEETFGRKASLIREGGSIPIVDTFKRLLNADTLLLGLALPDCRCHAPDENFDVECFEKGIALNKNFIQKIARI